MRQLTLCRERLARIQRVLNKNAGALTVRDFVRSFSVWEWELEQAAALGWIQIETKKPHTGRPSRIVRTVSQSHPAKLPPWRCQIEKEISTRHWLFALKSIGCIKGGRNFIWRFPPLVDAYQRAFPRAQKRRAATASMSRLLHHPDVKAARAIWQRLRELGSWRVRG